MTGMLAPGLEIDKLGMLRILRRRLGLTIEAPTAFGPCGLRVCLFANEGEYIAGSVIVTQASHDGAEWIHASIARVGVMPTYSELATLKDAVFGPARYAYQVFPPSSEHVNIHEHALHLWGRADGTGVLPKFGSEGTI